LIEMFAGKNIGIETFILALLSNMRRKYKEMG
jgi:hypothetical protein